MHTGSASPPPGLTCSPQLPPSLPQHNQCLVSLPVHISSDQAVRNLFVSVSVSHCPKASGREMGRLVVIKGNPILGKP
ncbi:hypothetical protein PBY51_000232 [Eleginops maclovinus]|uniref:Uncharacterized protein n=1 Tax=Eleginops maclovinus TaxID=56733 RepID=A0AAN8AQ86_ELEMC|nr:hypothetical protein PBY51_000232 [Eleginops maclovinus]